MTKHALLSSVALSLSLGSLAACGEDATGTGNEAEVISRVELVLTAPGAMTITAAFDDPDGDGGLPPTVDPLPLTAGMTYAASVRFLNALETPAEDITLEVSDESDVHQVFFTGTAVTGPASSQLAAPLTHAYADMDINGLPVGLLNMITVTGGSGDLIVTLRHLPPVGGQPVKTADLASRVLASGFSALPGATDAQVTFPVAVPVP